jgi:hypothetical protein
VVLLIGGAAKYGGNQRFFCWFAQQVGELTSCSPNIADSKKSTRYASPVCASLGVCSASLDVVIGVTLNEKQRINAKSTGSLFLVLRRRRNLFGFSVSSSVPKKQTNRWVLVAEALLGNHPAASGKSLSAKGRRACRFLLNVFKNRCRVSVH